MAAGTAADAAEFERLHRELLADPSLQFQFERIEAPPVPPDWLQALAKLLASIAPFLNYIFWGTQEPYYSKEVIPFIRGLGREKAR